MREDYHVHFILHGKGYLRINHTTYTLKRGQIFVTPPDVEVYYWAEPSDPWHYTWVSFTGTKAAYFLEKAGLTPLCPIRDSYVKPEEFLMLTEKILNHHELTIANELLRTSLLYEIISLLVNSYTKKKIADSEYDYSPDVYVNAAIDYIHHNYQHIKVSDIAERIGISRFYLTSIFKEKYQMSPQQYIVNYRLSIASNLLKTTELSIQDISEKVGYSNPLSFSKIFKSNYGISPKYFRDNSKKDQN